MRVAVGESIDYPTIYQRKCRDGQWKDVSGLETIRQFFAGRRQSAQGFAQNAFSGLLPVGDPQEFDEFGFEMEQSSETRSGSVDVVERPEQQIVKRRVRVLRFDRCFEKLATVSREQGGVVIFSQPFAPIPDGNFAKTVEFTPPGMGEIDFRLEKEIEFTCKGAFRTKGTFGDGFDETVILRKPMHDQTGIGQTGQAGDDRGQLGKD
jgi:hypothetical protein